MENENVIVAKTASESPARTIAVPRPHPSAVETRLVSGVLLGPFLALAVWLLPLEIDRTSHIAFAVVVFMTIYWIMEPVEHAVTALIGCYLFWALGVAKFSTAFSGFANSAPWFLFGALLIGQAASHSGLAKRLGYAVLYRFGSSYSALLFGIIGLSFLLNFIIPSGMARLSVMAPIVIGIITAFGLNRHSNVAKGLFIILTYTSALFDRMIMAGAASILTRGIVEEQSGVEILWSQWLVAYLPAIFLTLWATWLVTKTLFPAEKQQIPEGDSYLAQCWRDTGPWTQNETKTLIWLMFAIGLWVTDFIHHTSPAVVALGVGLGLALPNIGVLDNKALKQVNLYAIIFSAGALSMGTVLAEANALSLLTDTLLHGAQPLLDNTLHAAPTLYCAAFLYHFLLANDQSMLSTSLPVLLQFADARGFNPVAMGLIWNYATGARLFVYQSSVLLLGYSYGYFQGKDLIKVGLVLTLVQGVLLALLVPLYWPLIGLHWLK